MYRFSCIKILKQPNGVSVPNGCAQNSRMVSVFQMAVLKTAEWWQCSKWLCSKQQNGVGVPNGCAQLRVTG